MSFADDAQNGSFGTTSLGADGCTVFTCSQWELSSPGFSFTDGASFRVWITTTRPGAPQGVDGIEFNPGHISEFPPTVHLNWSAPRSAGGTPITGYKYRYWTRPDRRRSDWIEVPGGGSATSVLFGRPAESSGFVWAQVVATNDSGDGEFSTLSSVQRSSEVSPSGISFISAGNGNIINMNTKEVGFTIRGGTRRPEFGRSADLSVVVWVGTEVLTTTTVAGDGWSVRVPANAPYITEPSVTVTGITTWPGFAAESVQEVVRVDLTPPSVSYLAPDALQVGLAITDIVPSTTATDILRYSATGLPPGLSIDRSTGVISGAPDTANASTRQATVRVTDTAGNTAEVPITFPAVASGLSLTVDTIAGDDTVNIAEKAAGFSISGIVIGFDGSSEAGVTVHGGGWASRSCLRRFRPPLAAAGR